MMEATFFLTHRQLVSAMVALLDESDALPYVPYLARLGYSLQALELPMVSRDGQRYTLDVLAANLPRNSALLFECKTWSENLKEPQIHKYLGTSSEEVLRLSGMTAHDHSTFTSDAVFIFMPNVENSLRAAIQSCQHREISGVSLVTISPMAMICIHNEFSDGELSNSFANNWDVDFLSLPLERLPYSPDCRRKELADAILQTVLSCFVEGVRTFTVEELCKKSNEWWPYLGPKQEDIRRRVRDEIRTMSRSGFRDWFKGVKDATGMVAHWEFKKPSSIRRGVLDGFARRHRKYVEIVENPDRNPRPEDFVGIDEIERDQMTLQNSSGQVVEYAEGREVAWNFDFEADSEDLNDDQND